MKKIFITGCARSGTTLLARMFHAYEDTHVITEEVSLGGFVECCKIEEGLHDIIVGKRTEYSIFSNILSQNKIDESLELIKDNDILVINCIRDGRYVVDSWVKAWTMFNPFAWLCAIKQSFDYKNYIQLNIKYEDLLNCPDEVQIRIEECLSICSVIPFSSYPSFVPIESFESEYKNYQLRPLEITDNPPPLTYAQSPNDVEMFDDLLKQLDYEMD